MLLFTVECVGEGMVSWRGGVAGWAGHPDPGRAFLRRAACCCCRSVSAEVLTGTSVIPLRWSANNELLAFFTIDNTLFKAVVDTGSPFLAVPRSCQPKLWGCLNEATGARTPLSNTFEIFNGREGDVEWRRGVVDFPDLPERASEASDRQQQPLQPPSPRPADFAAQEVVFGVLADSLIVPPGGVFLGLVRRKAQRIRPTFLQQTRYRSLRLDFAASAPSLMLSAAPLIKPRDDYVLLRDLRPFGDPISHFASLVRRVTVDGMPLVPDDGKPVFAIWDTGATGFTVDQQLYRYRDRTARENNERRVWGTVEIAMTTHKGKTLRVKANRPLTTPVNLPWKGFKGHLIVIGLAFMPKDSTLTVDTEKMHLWFERSGGSQGASSDGRS